ncbi:hypothetical protein QK281_00540 [Aeromonas hydrophila]|uniref:hypothetical protein n=1 Tax=Aeromonas hydrophila TaxID=644 RepID=UPI00249DBEF0|nr:hypothetical protein [Aeromonas hydrophila]WGY32389.1 hypothetical protein QK281_00540 [Aeromonas hydrophila]HDC4322685.1 hypothetical protein [Aeromonas hydrophila]
MYGAEGEDMRIDHYDLQGEVQYQQQQAQSRKVRRLGPVPAASQVQSPATAPADSTPAAGGGSQFTFTRSSLLTLQMASRTAAGTVPAASTPAPAKPAETGKGEQDGIPNDGLDNHQRLIKLMIEAMLGHEIELPDPIKPTEQSADGVNSPTGDGSQPAAEPDQLVEVTDSLLQKEQLNVVASANIETQDGQSLQLDLGFVLDWRQLDISKRRTTLNALKDPLVLSLDGKIAGLTGARVKFDIDQDGKEDSLPGLSEGSGFVALDRNGNGTIDDGGELFGARTGNGFGELATLDEDGNGVLDERDSQFSALQFWQPEQSPIALVELGIGAILLHPLDTPFNHLGESGNQGVLRQSGLYVTEQGKGGWVQQVDLRV